MLGATTVKTMTVLIAHWVFIVFAALACTIMLMRSDTLYLENTGYQTTNRLTVGEFSQLVAEEHLIISHETFTLTVIKSLDTIPQSSTVNAKILDRHTNHIQAKVEKLDLEQDPDVALMEVSPPFFFKRQYILQKGSILNYEFLPTASRNTLCFYIHELERLRCMHSSI